MQRPDRAGRLQLETYFGASEATIFSKRGSPRNESQNGKSFNWPKVSRLGGRMATAKLLAGKIVITNPGGNHRQLFI